MKAMLSCVIPIQRVAVFAELAFMQRRPELGLLCTTARARGRRITAETVHAALPGLSDAGARNIIAWCTMLGCCDQQGGLSRLGDDVADTNEAPVPEQGVYGFWLAEHPLLGRRILAVERLASRHDPRFNMLEPLPMQPERGKVFQSVLDAKERFVLRDLPANNEQPRCVPLVTNATCTLHWTIDFEARRDHWMLQGVLDDVLGKNTLRGIKHEPESDGLDVWQVAARWGESYLRDVGQWNPGDRQLAVVSDGLVETEIQGFRKTLQLARAEVPGKGIYENVKIEDIPLAPYSNKDAQQWAMARWQREMPKDTQPPKYRSRADVRARFAALTEGTPLARLSPTLPAHEDLLRNVEANKSSFWSLAAPVDLALNKVSPDELGPLRIGGGR